MTVSAGIRALAVAFPSSVRTNDYWRSRHPEVIAALERKAATQVWEASEHEGNVWAEEMARYLPDVFRGSVERRVLRDDERILDIEERVVRRALAAAKMSPGDLDMLLLSSFYPDQVAIGNAVFLAERIGLTCPCLNVESACGAPVADLLLATSLVESGRARNVLVVVSCAYSRALEESHPMAWTSGDGAAAFLVGRTAEREILGSSLVGTPDTTPVFTLGTRPHPLVGQTPTFAATRVAADLLAASTDRHMPRCVDAALDASGMTRADADFVVFPTPTAWYAAYGCRALGIPAHRTIDTYPRFTNTGPVLSPANLYFAARAGQIRRGDRVVFTAQGSMSTAGAAVLHWGDVALAEESDT